MRKFGTHLWMLGFWIGIIALISAVPVLAQGQNLLINPGFEPPFVTVDGAPPRQVAQGWLPWHIGGGQSESENVQPEYYPASDATNGLGVPRIRNGSDAQQYHSWYATHDGGVYQQVGGIQPGATLRFSAYVYVWSSTYEDVNRSEQPGGIVVRVGIDPSGGSDPANASIVWSDAGVQYDAFSEYSVSAVASGSAVTVFVRSTVTQPVQNNNIYVDDASLVVEGATQPPTATTVPTNTAVPTNTTVPPTAIVPPTATTAVTAVPTATLVPTETTTVEAPPASPSPTSEVLPVTATAITPLAPTATLPDTIGGTPISVEYPWTVLHTVERGDTVAGLATLYGSSVDAILIANKLDQNATIFVGQPLLVPVRVPPPLQTTPSATAIVIVVTPTALAPTAVVATLPPDVNTIYIVQPGDTLLNIANRFRTTVAVLAQLNGITNPNVIRVGQRLLIPAGNVPVPPTPVPPPSQPGRPTTYTVQPGDTLFRIALRFGIPVPQLIQANGILNPNRVFVGQVLVVP
jgi:LysM repeat protein